VVSFDHDWSFFMGADTLANGDAYPKTWRAVRLPHDWSIEADFSSVHPATNQGGALPGGIGWYRKTFRVPKDAQDQLVSVEFDGVHAGGGMARCFPGLHALRQRFHLSGYPYIFY
jgi:beta-galactosidase